jgi:hypothetical protein
MPRPRILTVLVSAFTFAAAARLATAQSFGPGDQVTPVGAAAFKSIETINDSDGYGETTAGQEFWGPVPVPSGAEIVRLCVYARFGPSGGTIAVELAGTKLVTAGTGGILQVPGSFVILTTAAPGYAVQCTEPFSFTYVETMDVDGDQAAEHIALNAHGAMAQADSGFGGVRVFWRRKVSPSPGSPTFNDVPASDGAFQFVEALVASGITAGCGNGNYCPDAPLTRRQMAVFLSKALGLHWIGDPNP